MPKPETNDARVAILASPHYIQARLTKQLSEAGMNVVATHVPGEDFLSQLYTATANVLLIDLGDDIDTEICVIDQLPDNYNIPILISDSRHDGGSNNTQWTHKLIQKLSAMANTRFDTESPDDTFSSFTGNNIPGSAFNHHTERNGPADKPSTNIWVLGASLGGPDAVREFLNGIDPDLPVCFLLVQQISAHRVPALIDRLQPDSVFKLVIAREDYPLKHHEVIVIPAGVTVEISDDDRLNLTQTDSHAVYAPNIDQVIQTVVKHRGQQAGVILFSGMGNNGVSGAKLVARQGGEVWAQDSESCVISNLPDQARKADAVSFSGNPSDLSYHLGQKFNAHDKQH